MNPGLTPESSRAAPKGDAYPFGLSSDAANRPCPRQKRTFAPKVAMYKYTVQTII